ncbi:MAG: ParB/RepB/Spo0J family partition protein [Ruminococcus sp.]|nr:ParB/RepB/Spo0J family partition protein [Ruminococcus sp.]
MAGFLNLTKEKQVNKVVEIEICRIIPNPNQPRRDFKESEIVALAESISQNGILQPLSVRKIADKYEIIAGERRLRAAKMCELHHVPCIVYDMNDRDSAILAIVENIQRQDLSFFEEATAIEKLIEYYGLTQEEAASKLGKAQSTVANKLRILRLTEAEREIVSKFNLTERHARALLRLGSAQERLFLLEKIVKNKLNVEKTELLIDNYIGKVKEKQSYKKRSPVFQNVSIFVNTINKAIQTMQSAGIAAESRKIQGEEYIEYRVRIPMRSV